MRLRREPGRVYGTEQATARTCGHLSARRGSCSVASAACPAVARRRRQVIEGAAVQLRGWDASVNGHEPITDEVGTAHPHGLLGPGTVSRLGRGALALNEIGTVAFELRRSALDLDVTAL